MTTFTEKTLTNLLDGAQDADGDQISLHRINNVIPTSWPHTVSLPQGTALVDQDGTILFDDGLGSGGSAGSPPNLVANGSFTFTVWDGLDESDVYTATVSLEVGGFTSTAPAQPSVVVVSGETSSSFDVTLPADPDDGGDPITKRVVSIMPQAEYDASNFANATYLNDFSALETRTITASNYGALGSAQTHVVRWKAINGSTDNSGHGTYSTPVTATLPAAANPPVFTVQPSLSGGPFTVGDTVTLGLGSGTGDNTVTASIEYFRLGSASKLSELSGLNWNSAGEAPGLIYLRTRLTDDVTGAFTLSNEVSVALQASGGTGSVKDQVIALFGTSGRSSVNSIQTLNSGNAPSGVSFGTSAGGTPYVTISGQGVTLENYIVDGRSIFLNSNNVTIRQCQILEGSLHTIGGASRLIDIKSNVQNFLIEDNDFIGTKGTGAGVSSAIFQRTPTATTAGIGGSILRNRFKWLGQDIIKPSGGVLVEENVLYAPSNVAALPDTSGTNGRNTNGRYSSSGTYALGEIVKHTSNEKHYISLIANNSQSLSNGSAWRYFDPHYDLINPFDNVLASTIRRNLIIADPRHSMIPSSERSFAVGDVYKFSIQRNNSAPSSNYFQQLTVEENVILGHNTYFSNPVFSAANLGSNRAKPIIQGNYLDADSVGRYTIPGTDSNVVWGTNYDATTGAIIGP